MSRGSVTASFLLAWLDCGGKKHSGSTGFGKEGGGEGRARPGWFQNLPSWPLTDGLWKKGSPSVGACHFPANSGAFNTPTAPESKCQRSHGGGGCGGASTIFGILRHNSLIGDPPPIHPIPQPQDLHGSLRQGGAKVRQKQKQPMFSSTRRIDINAFQIWNVSGNSREVGILESGSELAGRIWGIMTNREQQDKSCKSQCDFCSGDSFTACPEANLGGVFMSCHASPRP